MPPIVLIAWPPLRIAALLLLSVLGACNPKTSASLVASGKELGAKKEHVAAVIQFKSAVQQSPDSAEVRLLLGQAMLAAGDPASAELELGRALTLGQPPDKVLPSLAKTLVQLGDNKKLVLTHGSTVLADKAAQAAFQTQLATAWGRLGDRVKTSTAVAAALAAVPEYGPAVLIGARLLADKGQLDEAAKVVDGVLARDSSDYEAWQLRGDLHNANGESAAAEAASNKALVLEKQFIPAHVALVAIRLSKGDLPGARKQADQLRAIVPVHPTTAFVDAHLSYAAEDFTRARELIQRLLLVAPDHHNVLMLAGSVEAKLGTVAQAAAYFGKVLALKPELLEARENLAGVEIRQGQYAKALETLKPLMLANATRARALALAGDAELRLGNAGSAERLFQRAAKLDPTNAQLQTAAVVSRLSSGDPLAALGELQSLSDKSKDTYADEALFAARVQRREYDEALAVLDTMSKKTPGLAAHLELRGRVLLEKRDFAGARQSFEQAYKADPGLFGAISSLVSLDLFEKKPARAMERLQAVIAASPQNSLALLMLAELKARNNAPLAEIKQLIVDAVKATPTLAEPRLRLINFSLQKRQFKAALTYAQDALAAMPGDTAILDTVGQAQMQAGDVEQAASTFRKLAAAMPTSALPYLRIADSYLSAGKAEQAEVAVKKALELEPDNAAAQTALIDLLTSSGRKGNALEFVRRIKQSKPNQASSYALEAAYHIRVRDNEAALAVLREGLVKTNAPDLASRVFSLLFQMGRGAEASKFGGAWIKQHPQDAAFEYLMSVQDITRGELKLAEARLKRVVVAYPTNTAALNNLAWVMVQNGSKGAVDVAQRAVQLLPGNAPLLDTLALALAADKQIARALEVQKQAVELAPADNKVRLGLGRLAVQAGDKVLARSELQRLQALGAAFAEQAEVTILLQGL